MPDWNPADLLRLFTHLPDWLRTVGYLGLAGYLILFAIIFAESGLLIGIFLPGDSLLFTAGFLASAGVFHLPGLVLICVVAAISGDSVGYAFGYRVGRRLFERPDSRFFKRKHLIATEQFYEKHGGKTIILARFLPVVRTGAPIVAGVARMHYPRFLMFNVVGGLLWGSGLPGAGFLFGSLIPDVDRYLIPVILLIIAVSALPTLYHLAVLHREEIAGLLRGRRRGSLAALKTDEVKD